MVCYGCWDTALSRVRVSKSPRALPSRCRYGHGNQGSVPAECVQPVGATPNPFNPSIIIAREVPEPTHITLTVCWVKR